MADITFHASGYSTANSGKITNMWFDSWSSPLSSFSNQNKVIVDRGDGHKYAFGTYTISTYTITPICILPLSSANRTMSIYF